jgi:hypothetical protein
MNSLVYLCMYLKDYDMFTIFFQSVDDSYCDSLLFFDCEEFGEYLWK